MGTKMRDIIVPEGKLFSKPVQLGIIVRDLNETIAKMKDIFGFEVDGIGETPDGDKWYRYSKDDFAVLMGFYNFPGIQIELLQPSRGKSVWGDYLDEMGEGLHHILFHTNDFEAAKKHLEDRGMMMVSCGPGLRMKGSKWAYFDARKQLGYYVELLAALEFGLQPQECD